jgi:flagellar basal-body rod protein FlgB
VIFGALYAVLLEVIKPNEAIMNFANLSVMNLLQHKMQYTAERQDYISQNIASADIPKYRRQDVRKPDFSKMVKSYNNNLSLNTTHHAHLTSNVSSSQFVAYQTEDTVELDQEAVEMMKNRSDYTNAATTYKKILTILKDVTNSTR